MPNDIGGRTADATALPFAGPEPADERGEYEAHLRQVAVDLRLLRARGVDIDAATVVAGLKPKHDLNRIVRDVAKRELGITERDLRAAEHRAWVRQEVGGAYPDHPTAFVEAFAAARGVAVSYKGVVTEAGPQASRVVVQQSALMRDLRVEAYRLHLPFIASAVDAAASRWVAQRRAERLPGIVSRLRRCESTACKAAARAALTDLCARWFDPEQVSAEFAAAVVLKFVHQVKRKMQGLAVNDHLMPVLLGRQGQGKSTFVRKLLEPVEEVSKGVDFGQITDERIIDIWSNHAFYLDEMARATKADIASVKHVITAETLTRRPMRSNSTEQVRQCATLIGTADATSLAELIRDPTGMRRFVALPVVKEPDWAALDGIDWVEVWRCIEAEEADPMLPHRGALQEMQESIRDRSPVECWADNIDPKRWLDGALSYGSRFSAKWLYMDFREYEDTYFEGPLKTSIKAWGMEMAAAIADGRVPFEKVKTNKCSTYVWTGPMPDTKGIVRDLFPKKVAGSLGPD